MKISLKEQIAAVQRHIEINVASYTHGCGSYHGRIPPGPELDETNALRAAVKTLKSIKPKHHKKP